MTALLAIHASMLVALGLLAGAPARAGDADERALVGRYVGSWDVSGFLAELDPELRRLLGPDLAALRRNLSVTGSIDYYGGALAVSGNAPHQGTEEEAVVCVQTGSQGRRVHAAILSGGQVTVHTREREYRYLPICIKDWITLANSRHAGRLARPGNVRLVGAG